jgi:hypothetical protein
VKRDEGTRGWRKLRNLYSSPSIIRMVKSRWIRACRTHGVERNSYRILVGRPEGNRRLGREDNIKLDLREII